jgi:hypothetical protein
VFTAAGCGSSSAPPTVTVNVVNHDAASAFLQGCSSCGSTSVGLQSGWGAGFPEKKLPVAYKIVVQGVASVCPQTTTVAGKNGPEIDYAVNAAGNCVVEANTANG